MATQKQGGVETGDAKGPVLQGALVRRLRQRWQGTMLRAAAVTTGHRARVCAAGGQ